MVTTAEPVRWDRTIYRGTDHEWVTRRLDANEDPIIPTEAHAQVRSAPNGALWIDCTVTIDDVDGWIKVSIPKEETEGDEWDVRREGTWDLEVVVSGLTFRWVMGLVKVSQEVTDV